MFANILFVTQLITTIGGVVNNNNGNPERILPGAESKDNGRFHGSGAGVTSVFGQDLNNLSELPLSALLKVKKSINEIMSSEQNCETFRDDEPSSPMSSMNGSSHTLSTFHENATPPPHLPLPASLLARNFNDDKAAQSRTFSDFGALLIDKMSGINNRNRKNEHHNSPRLPLPPQPPPLYDDVTADSGNLDPAADKNRKTFPIVDGGGGGGDGWHQDDKQNKVQKVFQLSITALAFLAFGGYLLCMIVQAIKSKGTTYFHPSYVPASGAASLIKKKKPSLSFGRRKRTTEEDNAKSAKNGTDSGKVLDDLSATPSPDDLYKGLVLAAENYATLLSY